MKKLKCPFCGSKTKYRNAGKYVHCFDCINANCHVIIHFIAANKDEAVKCFNRRVDDYRPEDLNVVRKFTGRRTK